MLTRAAVSSGVGEGGSIWPIGSMVVANVFSFLNAVILTRIFDADAYGIYRYVLAWIIVSSFFTLAYSHLPVTQAVIEGKERTFLSALRMRMKFGVSGLVFFGVLALYYYLQGNALLASLFAVYAPFVILSETLTSFVAYLHGKKWLRTSFYFDLFSAILGTLCVVGVAYATHNIILAFLANIVSTFVPRLFGVLFVAKRINRESPAEAIEKYSLKLTASGAFEVASQMADKTIVFHLLGAPGLAFYIFATLFVDQFRELGRILIWKYVFLDSEKRVPNRTLYVLAISAGAIMLYALTAPFLYKVFFPAYASVTILSILYSLTFLTAASYLYMYEYQTTKSTRYVGMYNISMLIATSLAVWFGSLVYGVAGAVTGLLLSKFVVSYGMVPLFRSVARLEEKSDHANA